MTSPKVVGINLLADEWSRREMQKIFRENEIRCPHTKRRLISLAVELRDEGLDELGAVLYLEQVIDCIMSWQEGRSPE